MKPISFFPLAIAFLILGAGCIQRGTTSVSPPSTAVSTAPASSSSRLLSDDSATWPRFEFPELGLSVKLPFAISSVTTSSLFCKPNEHSSVCDTAESPCQQFTAAEKPATEAVLGRERYDNFLTSVSQAHCTRDWLLPHMYDFYPDNGGYHFTNASSTFIHPLQEIFPEGNLVVIFDSFTDLYEKADNEQRAKSGIAPSSTYHAYSALIKLPHNGNFKAALMGFNPDEVSLEQLREIVPSIKFD